MGARPITLGVDFPEFDQRRVTADEYFSLPDDGYRYEVVHGVMFVAPGRPVWHQGILTEFWYRLDQFVRAHDLGMVLFGSDINVTPELPSCPTIYCPDLLFLNRQSLPLPSKWLTLPPTLVAEISTDETREADTQAKYRAYERFGIEEYWNLDPLLGAISMYRNQDGRYVEIPASHGHYESIALPGFRLDRTALRDAHRRK